MSLFRFSAAEAIIVTGTADTEEGVVRVNLTNTLNANQIISAGQALSGFSFTLSDAFANPGSPPRGVCRVHRPILERAEL